MSWFDIIVLAALAFIQLYAWASYTMTGRYIRKMDELNAARYRDLMDAITDSRRGES